MIGQRSVPLANLLRATVLLTDTVDPTGARGRLTDHGIRRRALRTAPQGMAGRAVT